MDREEKELILNGIHTFSAELERDLKYLRDACKFGLRKGKLAKCDWIATRCRQLADDLEDYMKDEFTLSDMQDYIE
jgi:hypothetical protein